MGYSASTPINSPKNDDIFNNNESDKNDFTERFKTNTYRKDNFSIKDSEQYEKFSSQRNNNINVDPEVKKWQIKRTK